RAPIRRIISRRTSPSICCPRSTTPAGKSSAATSAPGTLKFAGERSKAWISFWKRMQESELATHIRRFLEELKRNNVSPQTLKAYGSDLEQFLDYFSPPGSDPPGIAGIGTWEIREWLGSLYEQKLTAVSARRKLAALRAFFRFLAREGSVA